MALTTQTYAEQLGRAFAEAARGEENIVELWVSTRPGGVDLWVLTQPIDMAAEKMLYRFTDTLYARFKTADFQVYTVNPRHFRDGGRSAIPGHAVQIPLQIA
ncbi:MAG TPA: hypothetical protein VFH48_19450 [Chloroflexota bacterium]|nr:hypothetical protein [Chloroflexota bacterium]